MFSIVTDYMEHDGGTKFYEAVQITEKGGPSILIKRYGKVGNKMGGGQYVIERGSAGSVATSTLKIISDKEKRGYGKTEAPHFGLHPFSRGSDIDARRLYEAVAGHYDRPTLEQIANYFGLTRDATGTADDEIVETAPEPEAAVVRDETWASW